MEFAFFYEYYPDLAMHETRSMEIAADDDNVPIGHYGYCEMFCADPACDCRRVILNVTDEDFNTVAMIGYGWENEYFYKKWFGSDYFTREDVRNFMGPVHHNGNAESEYADFFLNYFKTALVNDTEYIKRIKKHYRMVKNLQKNRQFIKRRQQEAVKITEAASFIAPFSGAEHKTS